MARNDQRRRQNHATLPAKAESQRPGYLAIKALLRKHKASFAEVLPRHLDARRLVAIATSIVSDNPGLQKCEPRTVLSAVHRAASLGLDLGKGFNEAFLIPRRSKELDCYECQFQIGFQGLRKLALQSGQVRLIRSELVFRSDVFHYRFNPLLDFLHEPFVGPIANRGPVVKVYCHSLLACGESLVEVMDAEEVEAIRVRAMEATRRKDGSYPHSPWDTDWKEMARKTVLRRACKSLPRSTEVDEAIRADDHLYEGMSPSVVSASPFGRVIAGPRPRGLNPPHQHAGVGGADFEDEQDPVFEPGVQRPVYSEADDLPAGRMPGED